ncbi:MULTISPECIES: RNA polymerase sigma factor [Nocardioides]|uniref:RNA polymerase sigma factor n=1 Tax=Nocardioides vastitatis TaxID=2568655 RepID=A0ABW0Z901_9ACTN|nr:sigma-70 family RNA polymerase sigma factor [Nocardioides sp.]
MNRIISSDEFEQLYRTTVRDVFGYVQRRSAGDAENLVAEVYAVAWRRRSDLPPSVLRRAWLFGVARTLVASDARRHAMEEVALTEAGANAGAPVPHRESTEVIAAVRVALARLPDSHREVLQLVEWERLRPAELAIALGVRPGTARVRLHRARRALAQDPRVQALAAEPRSAVAQGVAPAAADCGSA